MGSKKTKHGMSKSRTYHTWAMMIQRCNNPKQTAFPQYGGRGIVVCDRWRESFENFYADMGERPAGRILNRIDMDGNYSPGNCRWATPKEQANNNRNNIRLVVSGITMGIEEASKKLNIPIYLLRTRHARGWTNDQIIGKEQHCNTRAITLNGETRTLNQWAKHLGISDQALRSRIKAGWSIEDALTTPRTNLASPKRQKHSFRFRISRPVRSRLMAAWRESEYQITIDMIVEAGIDALGLSRPAGDSRR